MAYWRAILNLIEDEYEIELFMLWDRGDGLLGDKGWGQGYDRIKRMVSVVITDHNLTQENGCCCNQYRLRSKADGLKYTDLVELDILELSKLPTDPDGSELWHWMRFTDYRSIYYRRGLCSLTN